MPRQCHNERSSEQWCGSEHCVTVLTEYGTSIQYSVAPHPHAVKRTQYTILCSMCHHQLLPSTRGKTRGYHTEVGCLYLASQHLYLVLHDPSSISCLVPFVLRRATPHASIHLLKAAELMTVHFCNHHTVHTSTGPHIL